MAREAGVGIGAVGDCEHELGRPSFGTLAAIREALERAGVEFTNGKKLGVRFGRSKSKGTKATAPAPSTMKKILDSSCGTLTVARQKLCASAG